MANDIQTIIYELDGTADDVNVLKVSDTGGAITLLEAYAVNHATTSGTASYTVALHKRNSSGTVISGTVGSLGGTAAAAGTAQAGHWTDLVYKTYSISSTYKTLEAGEVLSVAWAAVDGGSPTRGQVVIHYAQGKA